ncbi:hypothetical protein GF342_01410 [Candidatus Woesearchaeota archaeon]|nr:hypothetical protein [Candidatus Woesearchaeota archaeon]
MRLAVAKLRVQLPPRKTFDGTFESIDCTRIERYSLGVRVEGRRNELPLGYVHTRLAHVEGRPLTQFTPEDAYIGLEHGHLHYVPLWHSIDVVAQTIKGTFAQQVRHAEQLFGKVRAFRERRIHLQPEFYIGQEKGFDLVYATGETAPLQGEGEIGFAL